MEPVPLAPPVEGKGFGKRDSVEGRQVFPTVLFVLVQNGANVEEGWKVLGAMRCTGVQMLGLEECQKQRDLWSKSIAENQRRAKKRRVSVASDTAVQAEVDMYVRWKCHDWHCLQPSVQVAAETLKRQLQPIQGFPVGLRSDVADQPCLRKADLQTDTEECVLPSVWCSNKAAYLVKCPDGLDFFGVDSITPFNLCKLIRVTPSEQDIALQQGAASASGHKRFESREAYFQRGENWGDPRQQRTAVQEMLFGKLSFLLPNSDHATEVLHLCARIMDVSVTEGPGFPPIPGYGTMRRILIKLDMCLMMSRRVFHSPSLLAKDFFVTRYLSSDASPQAKHNFFCTIEEVLLQEKLAGDRNMENPFQDCMSVEKRSFPALTLGKGEASVAQKARLLVHSCCLEYGSGQLSLWRRQVFSFLSDQGTERHLPQFAVNLEGNLAEFCQNLARAPSSASADDPLLMPQALLMPGLLHILFNGLEEAMVQLPEWKQMERELSAATQIIAEASSQALFLEKMYADAPPEERALVHQFRAKLLLWRWESLQEVSHQWANLYLSLKARWSPEVFSDMNASAVQRVSAALGSPWHYLFLQWVSMFSWTIGKEASWLEGCFCHSDLLASQGSRWQRRRALKQQGLEDGVCVWQGRRLPALALGHFEAMRTRIQNAASPDYTSALFAASSEDARRMVQIDAGCKQAFCRLMRQKLGFFQTIPYLFTGGFAGYCGFSWQEAKSAVKKAMEDYASLAEEHRDAISSGLMQDDILHAQMVQFVSEEEKPLHKFPDLFFGFACEGFCVVVRLTYAERCRRVYACDRKDHFANMKQWEKDADQYKAAIKNICPRGQDQWLSDDCKQLLIFFKCLLTNGTFCSIPQELWQAALTHRLDEKTPSFDPHDLAKGLLSAKPLPAEEWRSQIFFSVVEAYPEAKVTVKMRQTEKSNTCIHVSYFPRLSWTKRDVVKLDLESSESQVLDLASWVLPHFFEQFCSKATLWKCFCETMVVHVQSSLPSSSLPLCMPDFLVDDDPLSVLTDGRDVRFADEDLALALLEGDDDRGDDAAESSAVVQFDTGERPTSQEEKKTMMALFQCNALSKETACCVWDLSFFTTAALCSLSEAGVIFSEADVLGEHNYWISDAMKVGPGLELKQPMPLILSDSVSSPFAMTKRKTCRVFFISSLLQDGWTIADEDDDLKWHKKGRDKKIVFAIWKRPESYLRALLLSDLLFQRAGGLEKIYHWGPAVYYSDLLQSDNLLAFAKMSEAEIKKYKSKQGRKRHVAQPALQNAEDLVPLHVPEQDLDVPPVQCREPRFSNAHVLYDRCFLAVMPTSSESKRIDKALNFESHAPAAKEHDSDYTYETETDAAESSRSEAPTQLPAAEDRSRTRTPPAEDETDHEKAEENARKKREAEAATGIKLTEAKQEPLEPEQREHRSRTRTSHRRAENKSTEDRRGRDTTRRHEARRERRRRQSRQDSRSRSRRGSGPAQSSRPLRRMDHHIVTDKPDQTGQSLQCPLCFKVPKKGLTEFSLAQHIWSVHAGTKEADEMLHHFQPASVEHAGRGRSLPAKASSVDRGQSVRSQRSVQSAPELQRSDRGWDHYKKYVPDVRRSHREEGRNEESEDRHKKKRKHREHRSHRSRAHARPARDDEKTMSRSKSPEKGPLPSNQFGMNYLDRFLDTTQMLTKLAMQRNVQH
eukprot:s2160_g10.t1